MRRLTFSTTSLVWLWLASCGAVDELALNPTGGGGSAPEPPGPSDVGGSRASSGAGAADAATEAHSGDAGQATVGHEPSYGGAPNCTQDDDCLDDLPRCSLARWCVECITDRDCQGDEPICNQEVGTCETPE